MFNIGPSSEPRPQPPRSASSLSHFSDEPISKDNSSKHDPLDDARRPRNLRKWGPRLWRLLAMLVLPLIPTCMAGAYPGPLEGGAGRSAAFCATASKNACACSDAIAVYCAACAGFTIMPGLVAYGSFVYPWSFRRLRDWLYIFGPALVSFSTFFLGGSAIVAFSAPGALEIPFLPAAVISSWMLPSCLPCLLAWTAHARRHPVVHVEHDETPPDSRFEMAPHPPAAAPARGLTPPSAVFDVDDPEPLAERARPSPPAAGPRRGSISSPEEMTESLATPHGARRLIAQLMLLFTGLLLIVYPMWGYLFLFSLLSSSGAAQIVVSVAFSFVSAGICFAFLRVFRSFLCALLPENGGQAFVILYLLHSVRLFRLMSSFQASSEYVLAFGVVSDLTITFAPLFVARASRAIRDRVVRLLAFVLRSGRARVGPPSEAGLDVPLEELGSPPTSLSAALDAQPFPTPAAAAYASGIAREGGRALFFLQALANMMASLQFVAIITVLRYSRVAPLFPYHPAALPDRDYAACILAALASAACLSLGLALLHLLSTRAAALHHARRRAVKDGFELGWEIVDGSAWRVVAVWAVSSMVSAPALVRVMRIYSVVFPRAYLPLDI